MQIIATLIPAHPNLEQMFMFSAVGFLVVIFVLMFLSYMTSFIGMFFAMKEKGKAAPAKPADFRGGGVGAPRTEGRKGRIARRNLGGGSCRNRGGMPRCLDKACAAGHGFCKAGKNADFRV